MKKTIITIAVLLTATLFASAQTPTKTYTKEGKVFTQSSSASTPFKGDQVTSYTWKDKDGNEYPIILHTYTKGEKVGRTTAYVIRTSKKTGKEYKYYLPEGESIAREILAESK